MRTVLFLSVIALLFLSGCQPAVTFDAPQPDGVENETAFKGDFIGHFISQRDSSSLTISPTVAVREALVKDVIPMSKLDSMGYKIKDNMLYERHIDKGTPVVVKNDTAYATWHLVDTLFSFNNRQVLRAMKGYYFLNYQSDSGIYKVLALGLDDGKLELGAISVSNDIAELKQSTHVKEYKNDHQVTTHYSSKPTKSEFNDFVKHGGFSRREVFVKVK